MFEPKKYRSKEECVTKKLTPLMPLIRKTFTAMPSLPPEIRTKIYREQQQQTQAVINECNQLFATPPSMSPYKFGKTRSSTFARKEQKAFESCANKQPSWYNSKDKAKVCRRYCDWCENPPK